MFRKFNLVGAIHELPLHVNKIVAEGLIKRLGISKLRFFVVSLLRMTLLVILSASEESN